ncbi:MAG: addiction module protein [Candidatus Hydrogenedentes bacterium]|nr:addiction module protein [Candidatus Hydrogenedentota bacterium]
MSDESRLLEEIQSLPTHIQIRIAESILDRIEEVDKAAYEESWNREIARRLEEIREGRVECVPCEEAMTEVEEMVRKCT